MKITRVGFDIAKQVFQVHGVDEHGMAKVRKTLTRRKVLEFFAQLPPCLIGMEACGGAHYWGRELTKFGHTVKLMAAQFVIPYRKRRKERCERCRGDLRGRGAAQYALRRGQDRGATSGADGAPRKKPGDGEPDSSG
jgi:transposase